MAANLEVVRLSLIDLCISLFNQEHASSSFYFHLSLVQGCHTWKLEAFIFLLVLLHMLSGSVGDEHLSSAPTGASAAAPAPRSSTDRTVAAHASWKWWRPASKTPPWEKAPESGDPGTGIFGRLFGGGKSRQKAPVLRRSASDLFDRPSGVPLMPPCLAPS